MAEKLTEQELELIGGGFGVSSSGRTYIVKKGDSLHSIAEQFGVTTASLAMLNAEVLISTARKYGKNPTNVLEFADYIFEGEELKIPG